MKEQQIESVIFLHQFLSFFFLRIEFFLLVSFAVCETEFEWKETHFSYERFLPEDGKEKTIISAEKNSSFFCCSFEDFILCVGRFYCFHILRGPIIMGSCDFFIIILFANEHMTTWNKPHNILRETNSFSKNFVREEKINTRTVSSARIYSFGFFFQTTNIRSGHRQSINSFKNVCFVNSHLKL